MDINALDAIDVHVHVEVDCQGHLALPDDFVAASTAYFGADQHKSSIDEIADYYRKRRIGAVLFSVDVEAFTGHQALSNEEIADAAAGHPDVLIPFASIDPAKGRAGARRLRSLVSDHGVRGLKLHPSIQNFAPDDGSAYLLLEVAQECGIPVLFHTGQTGIGANMRGGGGVRLGLSNPMLLDEVAVRFPDLCIIMAHPSFPWQDEALAVATHKPNVYIDLSGWSPKYFPPQLIRYANTLLADKVLFGSDYPMITPDRWLADFAQLDMKPHVIPKILKDNAVRVLNLAPEGTTT
ncbi:amidohydrolase family protein [Mycobacterium sp. AT1]|uniref:amidohydrolase family protein n=1 Tax=Mycobacterium sp. AT1 TaxID=1961706 RepID=UPI0009AC8EE0|nr:amidohydrolase family protein [Mycobacterium sp. AT1]OPX13331.1 4-hydroxyphenyl-beta-ketoacyl-CoA hydrolase [Mycobacterium sp. AT1]